MSTAALFATARSAIPAELLPCSGKVFYSGRMAFAGSAPLYVLGVNPGGDPGGMRQLNTVAEHTDWVANAAPCDWSAYRDESWKSRPPGQHGMQPRILHMFKVLGLNPGAIPASNLVFVRSRREAAIANDFKRLAGICWAFHRYVIENLRPSVILCLGKTAGDYVCAQVGALQRYATFTEQNERRWPSHAYRSRSGVKVVVATHPSIADWSSVSSDPTGLVANALHDA